MHSSYFKEDLPLLYRIGTMAELSKTELQLPHPVLADLTRTTSTLDREYGAARNHLTTGGYSLIVEEALDLPQLKQIINYDSHPCEWATEVAEGSGYVSALYLLNNDFSITVYMPIAIAPNTIKSELED